MSGRTRRRILLAAVALAAAAILVLVVLATRTWESRALTRAVLGALAAEDLRVDASSVRVGLLSGVRLADLEIDARIPDGRLRATADEATLSHRPRRLLAGEIVVEEMVLRRPDVEIVWDGAAAPRRQPGGDGARDEGAVALAPDPAPASSAAEGWSLAVAIDRLAIEDGRLVMREEGAPGEMVRFEGLGVELRDLALPPGESSPLLAATGTGEVGAARLVTPALVSERPRGALRLAGGHVVLAELSLPTEYGPLAVRRLDLDLGRDPYVYTLEGGGAPLDTAKLLGAASGFGVAELGFAFDGDGSEDGALRGGGTLEVGEGQLGSLPLLAAIERLLVGTELVGRPYEGFAVPFEVAGDLLTLHPFALDAGNLRLAGRGSIDLAGPLDLHLELAMPRADVAVKEIPREVLEALTDVDGRVKLPILVAGTLDAPRAAFDTRAWAGLAGRRAVQEGLRLLGGLLAKDEDG